MLEKIEITPPTCEVYFQETCLGTFNEYEFTDLRIRIAQEKLEGYFVLWEDQVSNILPSGALEEWPNGLFALHNTQLGLLLKLRLG